MTELNKNFSTAPESHSFKKTVMPLPQSEKADKTVSFKITPVLYEKFKNRVPRHGDRSAVLRTLVEKFLNGEVVVITKPRRI